jgi:hypothetical protein
VLLALTAAVLLAHIALLRATPMTLGLSQPAPTRAFTTRSIELVPTEEPASLAPSVPPQAPRRSKPPTPATRKNPAPANAGTGSDDSAPQPPAAMATADTPRSVIGPSQDEPPAAGDQLTAVPLPPGNHAAPVSVYTVPGSVRIKYQVDANKFPFTASAELLWQQTGGSYDARLALSVFGQNRVQTSHGQITLEGLAPIRFSDKYRSEVAAHFNREQGKVTFSANTPDTPLLAGAQDRLSILVQLAAMIAADPSQYPPATTIAIQTIGPRAADIWLFTVENEETLTLPGGEQATLKLMRNPRQEFDQKVELWLAPALGYLPARIRITEPNGDFIDQKWLATEPQT